MSELREGSPAYWRHHISESIKFDGTRAEYCRQHGIKVSRLAYYLKRFNPEPRSTFVPVDVKPKPIASTELPDPRWLAEFVNNLLR